MTDKQAKLFNKLKNNLLKEIGPKCEDYAIGCITCQLWRAYEDLYQGFDLE